MRLKLKIGAAVAAMALLLSACSGGGTTASSEASGDCKKVTKIRIATTPYQDSLIMALGGPLGWYAKACLDVSFVNVSYTAIMSTISGGKSADVAWNAMSGVNTTYHQDPSLVYLYPWDAFTEGNAILARKDSGMKSVDDFVKEGKSEPDAIAAVVDQFKGKKVVTTFNNVRDEILSTLLYKQQKPNDFVQKINLAPDQGLAAYLQGSGDLYVAGIPQRQKLLDEGYKIIISGPDLSSPSLNGYITKKDFWEKNTDALLALQNVTFMAIRYTDANLDEVANFVSKEYTKQTGAQFTAENFKTYWQKLELYPTNAASAQKMMFDTDGVGYWKRTYDQSNTYLTQIQKSVTEPAPDSAFVGEDFQKKYIAKYGADEKDWWEPTGKLG